MSDSWALIAVAGITAAAAVVPQLLTWRQNRTRDQWERDRADADARAAEDAAARAGKEARADAIGACTRSAADFLSAAEAGRIELGSASQKIGALRQLSDLTATWARYLPMFESDEQDIILGALARIRALAWRFDELDAFREIVSRAMHDLIGVPELPDE